MKTASILQRTIRFLPHLAVAGLLGLAGHAQSATSCGPSGRPGVERCVTGVSTATMMRMQQLQEASNWCWAASISMLLRRYGVEVPQREIVQTQLGNTGNVRIAADAMARLVDRRWTDAQGRSLVASVKPLPAWRMRLGVIASEVLDELAQERPVMLAAERHALLLVQVVYDRAAGPEGKSGDLELVRAVVLDPSSPGGVRSLRDAERRPAMLALVHAEVQQAPIMAAAEDVKTALVAPSGLRAME